MKKVQITWVYRDDTTRAAMIGRDEVVEAASLEEAIDCALHHGAEGGVDLEKFRPVAEVVDNGAWMIVVNENLHDACARIVQIEAMEETGYPYLSGWERCWGVYDTREEAESALVEAKEYASGRSL